MSASGTTKKQRRKHVDQTNANFAIEGFEPDQEDLKLQEGYVNGRVSLEQMLASARAFAAKAKGKAS